MVSNSCEPRVCEPINHISVTFMRTALLLGCLVATAATSTPTAQHGAPSTLADGVYVSIEALTGGGMVGSHLFDAAVMREGRPMRQVIASANRFEEVFAADTIHAVAIAESHGGEVQLLVKAIKGGRVEFAQGASGKHVVAHYNAWGTPYFSVFR
jgi:hypothetical protein